MTHVKSALDFQIEGNIFLIESRSWTISRTSKIFLNLIIESAPDERNCDMSFPDLNHLVTGTTGREHHFGTGIVWGTIPRGFSVF